MNKSSGEVVMKRERPSSEWTAVIDVEVTDGSPPELIPNTRLYDYGVDPEVNRISVSEIDETVHFDGGVEYFNYFEDRPDWLSFARDALQNMLESGSHDEELILLFPWSD